MNPILSIVKHWNRAENRGIIFFFLCVGMILASVFYDHVHPVFTQDRFLLHLGVIEGTAPSPYLYRVLVPAVGHGLYWLTRHLPLLTDIQAFELAYWVLETVMITGALLGIYYLLRIWYSRLAALLGALFVTLTLPMTFINQYFQPWSYAEVIFLVLMVFAAKKRAFIQIALIVLFATLNRETGFLTVLIFFLLTFDLPVFIGALKQRKLAVDCKAIAWTVLYSLIWLGVFLGLRYWRGTAEPIDRISEIMTRNFEPLALLIAALFWFLFFNVYWIWACRGFHSASREIKQLTLILPVYLVTIGIWGSWIEVRLLMPLYIVILPLGSAYAEQVVLPKLLERPTE